MKIVKYYVFLQKQRNSASKSYTTLMTKILYISQEIQPYTPENEISTTVRNLPEYIQGLKKEVRLFMPKYGCVNERRYQLHEVIRLSGLNLDIDNADYPLIIKVASVPQAKMQVYFIDNEELFQRKAIFKDENGAFFEDNDVRKIFFCRGVLETIKKLGWVPDIIHCNGWMTSLVPMYIKQSFAKDPVFEQTRIIYSAYNAWDGNLNTDLYKKAVNNEVTEETLANIKDPNWENLTKMGIEYADGVILHTDNKEVEKSVSDFNKPFIKASGEESYENINAFYDKILEENSITA